MTNMLQTVIPRISDPAAYRDNMEAIDSVVRSDRYRHIIAWGKWLGFTPETVRLSVEAAEADNAPEDSLQRIEGRWIRRGDIVNEENLRRVDELVLQSSRLPSPGPDRVSERGNEPVDT